MTFDCLTFLKMREMRICVRAIGVVVLAFTVFGLLAQKPQSNHGQVSAVDRTATQNLSLKDS